MPASPPFAQRNPPSATRHPAGPHACLPQLRSVVAGMSTMAKSRRIKLEVVTDFAMDVYLVADRARLRQEWTAPLRWVVPSSSPRFESGTQPSDRELRVQCHQVLARGVARYRGRACRGGLPAIEAGVSRLQSEVVHLPRLRHGRRHRHCAGRAMEALPSVSTGKAHAAAAGRAGACSSDATVSFRQIRAGELLGGRGTGFGLAIARGIVQAHGGSVGCHSDGEGRGSTFFFELVLPGVPALELRGDSADGDAQSNQAIATIVERAVSRTQALTALPDVLEDTVDSLPGIRSSASSVSGGSTSGNSSACDVPSSVGRPEAARGRGPRGEPRARAHQRPVQRGALRSEPRGGATSRDAAGDSAVSPPARPPARTVSAQSRGRHTRRAVDTTEAVRSSRLALLDSLSSEDDSRRPSRATSASGRSAPQRSRASQPPETPEINASPRLTLGERVAIQRDRRDEARRRPLPSRRSEQSASPTRNDPLMPGGDDRV